MVHGCPSPLDPFREGLCPSSRLSANHPAATTLAGLLDPSSYVSNCPQLSHVSAEIFFAKRARMIAALGWWRVVDGRTLGGSDRPAESLPHQQPEPPEEHEEARAETERMPADRLP